MRDQRHGRGIRGFARARAGVAGVEFAFVLPILLLLLIGSIEIGRALHDYHVVNESVRDAARYLGRVPVTCPAGTFDDPGDETEAKNLAMTGSVNGLAPSLLGYWTDAGTIDVTVTCLANGGEFASIYLDENLLPIPVPVIELTANVPFTFLFGLLVAPEASITFIISHTAISVGL